MMSNDVELETAYENTIRELKARVIDAEAGLIALRRKMGMPEACGHLGCDPTYSNLRCLRLKAHEGPGDAWSSDFEDAYRGWRQAIRVATELPGTPTTEHEPK